MCNLLDKNHIQPQNMGDPVFMIEVFNRREYIYHLKLCSTEHRFFSELVINVDYVCVLHSEVY